MRLVKAQNILEARHDAFFAWGVLLCLDWYNFNPQGRQQGIIIHVIHCAASRCALAR